MDHGYNCKFIPLAVNWGEGGGEVDYDDLRISSKRVVLQSLNITGIDLLVAFQIFDFLKKILFKFSPSVQSDSDL